MCPIPNFSASWLKNLFSWSLAVIKSSLRESFRVHWEIASKIGKKKLGAFISPSGPISHLKKLRSFSLKIVDGGNLTPSHSIVHSKKLRFWHCDELKFSFEEIPVFETISWNWLFSKLSILKSNLLLHSGKESWYVVDQIIFHRNLMSIRSKKFKSS